MNEQLYNVSQFHKSSFLFKKSCKRQTKQQAELINPQKRRSRNVIFQKKLIAKES